MSKEQKPTILPKLTTVYDMEKVAEIEQEIMLSLTEKRGFGKPLMNVVKGRDPSVMHDFHLIRQPSGSGFWLGCAQKVLAHGGTVMCMDTEAGLSERSLARIKQAADELETAPARPKRIDHVGPMSIPKWIDSMREINPELVSDGANIDEARWKELVPALLEPRKGGKHAKGKAVKRKHRHRKGK